MLLTVMVCEWLALTVRVTEPNLEPESALRSSMLEPDETMPDEPPPQDKSRKVPDSDFHSLLALCVWLGISAVRKEKNEGLGF